MSFLSKRTRETIKESFQTFVLAGIVFAFALLLTFVEDFAVTTKRPEWVKYGIEAVSVLLFIGDGLVMLAIIARIVIRAFREAKDELSDD